MKKIYFYIIILILKNIQPNDFEFKNQINNLTKNENVKPENRKEFIKTIVNKLNLDNQDMVYFNKTIEKKNFKITEKTHLLKIFHPDKYSHLQPEVKNKIGILHDHFSTFFFPNENKENNNLEKNEVIDIEKLLEIHQNLQIATIFAKTITKAIVFRLCVSKFKILQTKMLGILLSSIFLDIIQVLLEVGEEYIYETLKANKIDILSSTVINILLWNYFIKENLNKAYCTTLATCLLHILLIPIYRELLEFYRNSFILSKILDLFFKEYSKNIYKNDDKNDDKKHNSLFAIREELPSQKD